MEIKIDPTKNCPREILDSQVSVSVKYLDFNGEEKSGYIEIHKDLKSDIEKIFDLMYREKFPVEKVKPVSEYNWSDDDSCDDNNTSAFNYRTIGGTDKLSKHATGCAIDINPYQNHFIKYDVVKDQDNNILEVKEIFRAPNTDYDLNIKGTILPDSNLVKLFKDLGWEWGGDWTPESGRIDYQHFEKIV